MKKKLSKATALAVMGKRFSSDTHHTDITLHLIGTSQFLIYIIYYHQINKKICSQWICFIILVVCIGLFALYSSSLLLTMFLLCICYVAVFLEFELLLWSSIAFRQQCSIGMNTLCFHGTMVWETEIFIICAKPSVARRKKCTTGFWKRNKISNKIYLFPI